MRASALAAAKAEQKQANDGRGPDSPALTQLKEAIEANQAAPDELPDDEPNIDSITVPLPTESKTTIKLLLMHGLELNGDGAEPSIVWSTGYSIARKTATGRHPLSVEVLPAAFDDISATSPICESITGAVNQAAEEAQLWLLDNSDVPADKCAMVADAALAAWKKGLGDELDETIFDKEGDAVVVVEAVESVDESEKPADVPPDNRPAQAEQQDASSAAVAATSPNVSQSAPVVSQSSPSISQKTAIVSQIASTPSLTTHIDAEIAACAERIVAHSARLSELKAELKSTKKSWETASDELVELHGEKADILRDAKEREAAGRGNATGVSRPPEGSPATDSPVPIANGSHRTPGDGDSISSPAASPLAPESTEAHAARMAAAFAPDPDAAAIPATPELEAYDREYRRVEIEGLPGVSPKILEILHSNGIKNFGDWMDFPTRGGKNLEYGMLSAGGARLTEKRMAAIQAAMDGYLASHPRPVAVAVAAVATSVVEAEKPAVALAADESEIDI